MNISINSKVLKAGIRSIAHVLAMSFDAKSVFKNHICFLSDDSGTKIIGTNGSIIYESNLTESATVSEQGKVAVVYDKLVTCLEQIKGDTEVTLEYKDKVFFIRSGKKETQLKTTFSDDFTSIVVPETAEIKIPFESTQIIEKASLTLGRDATIKKTHGLFCELKEIDNEKVMILKTATTLSASKIFEKFECDQKVETCFVLPEFLVDEAASTPLKSLFVTENLIIAKFPNLTIQTPLLENVFVNVDAVMKNMEGKDISFNRDELRETVKFVKSTMDKNSFKMKFVVNDNEVEVSSFAENAKSKDVVKCVSEENFSFTLNCNILLNFLNSVTDEEIQFKVSEKIISYNKENYQFVEACYNQG